MRLQHSTARFWNVPSAAPRAPLPPQSSRFSPIYSHCPSAPSQEASRCPAEHSLPPSRPVALISIPSGMWVSFDLALPPFLAHFGPFWPSLAESGPARRRLAGATCHDRKRAPRAVGVACQFVGVALMVWEWSDRVGVAFGYNSLPPFFCWFLFLRLRSACF